MGTMRMRAKGESPTKFWAGILMLALAPALLGAAQDGKTPGNKESTAKAQKKPVLVDATRVSTDAAAQSAIKKETQQSTASKKSKDANDSVVFEFRPAAPNSESGDALVLPKGSKKKKNIHGEVFGTAAAQGAGAQGGGGAVGATSKSGKTSVYVESEHQRTTPPR